MKRVTVATLDVPGGKFTFLQVFGFTVAQGGIMECVMYWYMELSYFFVLHFGYFTFTVFLGVPGAIGMSPQPLLSCISPIAYPVPLTHQHTPHHLP